MRIYFCWFASSKVSGQQHSRPFPLHLLPSISHKEEERPLLFTTRSRVADNESHLRFGGCLAHGCGFSTIFGVSSVVGVLAVLFSLFLPSDRREAAELEDDDDLTLKQFFLIFREPRLLPVYSVIVI